MYAKHQFYVSCGVLVAVWGNFMVNYKSYKSYKTLEVIKEIQKYQK